MWKCNHNFWTNFTASSERKQTLLRALNALKPVLESEMCVYMLKCQSKTQDMGKSGEMHSDKINCRERKREIQL